VFTRLTISTLFLAATAVAAQAQAPAAPEAAVRTDFVKNLEASFDKADANNDGFITAQEMQSMEAKGIAAAQEKVDAQVTAQFQKLDTDKNGSLSLAEFKAAARVKANASPQDLLAKFDTNKDGKVSKAEYQALPLAAFDRADTNKDGKVTREEQAKAAQR
jgi:Ca2+-binding EF-hand superfamily protein